MRPSALSLLVLIGAASALASACGNSAGGTGTGTATSTGTGTASGSTTCPGDLAQAPGSAFCEKDAPAVDCAVITAGEHNQVCGVGIPTPTTTLSRSAHVQQYAGSGPPDLSCFQPANYPKAGTPQMVTVTGVAKIFAHGCASTGLTIEIHKVKRTTGSDNGLIGDLIGTAVTTPGDCSTAATGTAGSDPNMTCGGTVYECNYSYPNVPSETELLLLTQGDAWAQLYEYNDYIPNSQVTGGKWTHNVQALSTDDFSAIPQAAIGAPIAQGHGAIAGEAHDCGNVRLIGATVEVNVGRQLLTYFTDNEGDPLPATSATSTSSLGLYAALDVAPGPVSVGALGLVDGKITTVGWYQIQVYANAVTAVTFQGPRPFQIQ